MMWNQRDFDEAIKVLGLLLCTVAAACLTIAFLLGYWVAG
jgi:hypothetical protein